MLILDWLGQQGNDEHQQAGGNKEDDGEVEVVDATDDERAVAGSHTAACAEDKLRDHPR